MTNFTLSKVKNSPRNVKGGFSLVEALLSLAAFALIVTVVSGALVFGVQSTAIAGDRSRASFLMDEGLEAARNIRDSGWGNLAVGTYGLTVSGNIWTLSGSSDSNDIFTRTVTISSVSTNIKQVVSTVTWQQTPQRPGTVSGTTYLSNWQAASGHKGGMLVYGDGGTTTDAISYRVLASGTSTWGTAASVADIDGGTANRALRVARVFASSTRNEKILVSRHYNGTNQYIYAQVYNGTSWGNVQLLSSWAATTFLDVQNFDGTYLNNGDFLIVYSDNTNTPKFRVWNGASWSGASISAQNIGGIPNYIVVKSRTGTNEAMAVFFDQSIDTNSQYFNNSSGYATASWALHTEHATVAPVNTKQMVDFDWSPNSPLIGAMVYSNSGSDRSLEIKIWTANGTGAGAWSAASSTGNQGAGGTRLGAVSVLGRPGANTFIACNNNTVPEVICFESNFTPSWTSPTNQIIAAATDTGIQRTFHFGYEYLSGNPAIAVYSDNTVVPKLKTYNPGTTTWDASATSISTSPFTLGNPVESVRITEDRATDDLMIILADTVQDLYTVAWDGTNNAVYTTPSGFAFSQHGTNGSADTEYWFYFAWDKF